MTTSTRSLPLPCDDIGTGAPILFVHAFPFDARMWEPQRAAQSATRRMLTPDLSGFGRARAFRPRSSLNAHADDIAALLDALAIPRATLLGLSMGGYISLAFARRHPGRLAGLVLADTRATADSAEAKAGRGAAIAKVKAEGVASLVDTLLPRLLAPNAAEDVRERVRRIAADQPPAGVIAALGAMRDRPDETPVLAALAVPTLVIVGEADALTPPAEAKRMAEALPHGSIAVVASAGHLSNQEAPAAFNAVLHDWLDRNGL
jgi:pimeloyl-ACP methyl ester carboxylesterase